MMVYVERMSSRGPGRPILFVTHSLQKTAQGATHLQRFYHDGLLVGTSSASLSFQNFVTEAGSPFSVQFGFEPSKKTGFVFISGKDGEVLDGFTCTNGVYYPADSHKIIEMNEWEKAATEYENVRRFLIAH